MVIRSSMHQILMFKSENQFTCNVKNHGYNYRITKLSISLSIRNRYLKIVIETHQTGALARC